MLLTVVKTKRRTGQIYNLRRVIKLLFNWPYKISRQLVSPSPRYMSSNKKNTKQMIH